MTTEGEETMRYTVIENLDERRQVYSRLLREELRKLTPSMPGRYSGQQVAYAKGRAHKRFAEMERA